ncbi:uncharacterized protein PHALS_08359 [Plasmopara halstedii]|uniref:Uncharacterized protein n=1 Tax=Plasmopara halstedii TaxID=4781 RepID=A0A0P1ABI6_PLAHL|nr:uncharacterized protein PHALS_08359 [Plasmopara halstedii]CEG38276.1 hypothetical protein PHALS_08359 [Plasmopara halstedii]|eukprot:XP_024574645.1 hypothetical protein PHALS_08359 [Plasmopara halstedii]
MSTVLPSRKSFLRSVSGRNLDDWSLKSVPQGLIAEQGSVRLGLRKLYSAK